MESAYLEDTYPHNLLYGLTIRSPIAKGRLKLIQVPQLPPHYTMITAKDIPGKNEFEDTNMPVLAFNELSYIGEPVAILVGPDKMKLEEFEAQCKVIADEEKPFFFLTTSYEDIEENRAAVTREIQFGNTEEAFAAKAAEKKGKIVTESYSTGIQDHWYAEPAGAVTWYHNEHEDKKHRKASGIRASRTNPQTRTLIVKTATQWQFHVKRCVAAVLGLDPQIVHVEPTELSLHMDGKLWFPSLIACHAALGTFITKKPVRLILDREEDFLFSPKRCNSIIDIKSSIDENGNINAAEFKILVNLGAYGIYSEEILDQVCLGSIGCYNTENLKITAKALKTNIPPLGPFSGFGLSQGFFAIERHVSQIADMFGIDPARWRKNNIKPGLILPARSNNSAKNRISGDELLSTTVKMSDYYRKWASYELLRQNRKGKPVEKGENPRGIGIALGFQGNGLLYNNDDNRPYNAEVTLTKESVLEIKVNFISSENYDKIWAKVAKETMSIEPDMVRIITENSPDCGPSCASRNITAITKTIEKCCQAIRKQRFHSPLPITVRRSIKPQHGALLDGRFHALEGKTMDISGFIKPGMACAAVEISIDTVECIPKVRGVWLGVHGGKIISVNRARRSLTRGAVQALGWSFTECIEFNNGILPKKQFNNFAIPSPADIPPIYIEFIHDNDKESRGIGELPFTCIPAAFLQAVSQAMDNSFISIPLKRQEIWEMIRHRNIDFKAGTK